MPPDAQLSDPEGIESEYDTFMASGMQPTPENFNRFLESRGKYYNPQQVTETMKKKIAEETVKRAMIGSGPMGGAFPQFGPLNEMIYGKSAQRELDKNTARRDAIIKAMTGRQSLPAPATAAPQTQSQPTQNPSRARAEALRKRSELLRGLAQ